MSNPTLYCYKNCVNSKLVQIITRFTNTKLEIVNLEKMSKSNLDKLLKRSPTGLFPLLQIGDFFLSGSIAIARFFLERDEAVHEVLVGKDVQRRSSINMWIDFVSTNLWPFYDEIIGQILGKTETHQDLFSLAIGDLMQVLLKINNHLAFRTFVVDYQISFGDLVIATSLYPYFSLVVDEKLRANLPHLVRWYSFISNLKEVSAVIGVPRLCKVTQKPHHVKKETAVHQQQVKVENTQNKEKHAVKDSKTEKKADSKQQQDNKVEAKKEEKPKAEAKPPVTKEPEVKVEKKKNPLDILPPTPLDLDAFKREFLNTTDKKTSLNNLLNNFDAEGWSFWYTYYQKSGDQGKILFRTCNLKSNFLQKLDKFRKYSFSAFGVYGTEPNLDVEGVWMWRGKEIPEEVNFQ